MHNEGTCVHFSLYQVKTMFRRAMLHYVRYIVIESLGIFEYLRTRPAKKHFRMFIKEISDLINSDRSPICSARPEVILDPSIQKPLTHFSMVNFEATTH